VWRSPVPDLDPFAVLFGREDARIGFPLRGELAGLVFVAVETVDVDAIEGLQVAFAHPCEGEPVEPGVIRDEADHAPATFFDDAALGHPEEAHEKIVQPLPLRRGDAPDCAIRVESSRSSATAIPA